MAQNDDVQGISLRLTEEDIRKDCASMGIPYSALIAVGKRHRAQNTASQMADVLYIMMLAKSKGLNPIADNYSLIARPDDKGFSLTFNKEAALHVILNHPKVKKGAVLYRFIVNGKGERMDIDQHPEKVPGGWKLNEIDWELTAMVEIEAVVGGMLRGFAKYKACVAAGRDGNPKFLWLKDPVGMTMKQAYKDLANTKLDGALPEDDAVAAALLEAAETEQSSLPEASTAGATTTAYPPPAGQTSNLSDVFPLAIVEKAVKLGINRDPIMSVWHDQEKAGVSLADFEADLDKMIEARATKAGGARPAPAQKATEHPPLTDVPAKAAEPAAAAPESEKPAAADKPARAKKDSKPIVSMVGLIDGIAERRRTLKAKPGEQPKQGPKYLVLLVGDTEYFLWDTKLFGIAFEAMGDNEKGQPQQRVRIGYTVSMGKEDPPKEYYECEELEILPPAVPAKPEPEIVDAEEPPEEEFDVASEGPEPPDEPEETTDEAPSAPSGFLF